MKSLKVFLCVLALLVGVLGGAAGNIYANLPKTEELIETEEVFYSSNTNSTVTTNPLTGAKDELSIHFLELGNKYTGDCTFIKIGDVDILIDCGSRTNSIATVSNYLNRYVTDNTLEYVIVTHAHQDHYAGFATTTKVDSIFDLYKCKTIIDFGNATNQKDSSTMYQNYLRELNDEVTNGAKHYSAYDCFYENNGASKVFTIDAENNVTLEILYNYYYGYNRNLDTQANKAFKASSENDYSVCCLLTHGAKHFLFTGDLESDGESKMVDYYNSTGNPLPEVDVYKAGHHGSKTSSSEKLLNVIKPKTVCVCCCAGSPEYTKTNNNQFPTQDFITRISKYTTQVYVTTLCVDYEKDNYESFNGNIVVVSINVNQITINCSASSTILKDSEWFKANRTWPTN